MRIFYLTHIQQNVTVQTSAVSDITEKSNNSPLMKTLLVLLSILLFNFTPAQAATFTVTTYGQTSTLTSTEGYDFQVETLDSRFIRLVVRKPEGQTWALLLGVPYGQILADGIYTPVPGSDSFDAYPNMFGAGISLLGTDPFTGTMSGANTTSGSFTISGLELAGNTVNALRLDFDVRANGRQIGHLEFSNVMTVPEPGGGILLMTIGLACITVRHKRRI